MAGRKLIFELFPLTFEEFLIFKNLKKKSPTHFQEKAREKNKIAYGRYIAYYQEFMEYGGFPKVALEEDARRKQKLLEEFLSPILKRMLKTWPISKILLNYET